MTKRRVKCFYSGLTTLGMSDPPVWIFDGTERDISNAGCREVKRKEMESSPELGLGPSGVAMWDSSMTSSNKGWCLNRN